MPPPLIDSKPKQEETVFKYNVGDRIEYFAGHIMGRQEGVIEARYIDHLGYVIYEIKDWGYDVNQNSVRGYAKPSPLIDSATSPKSSRSRPYLPITEASIGTALTIFAALLYIHTGFSPFWLIEKLIQLCLK